MACPMRKWSDLSSRQKTLIVVGATVELALTGYALVDLSRRPGACVRGPKLLWAGVAFVQPVGPIAYLTLGRTGDCGEIRAT